MEGIEMSHYDFDKEEVAIELDTILYNSQGMFSKVVCIVYFDYYRFGEGDVRTRNKMLFNQLRNMYLLNA
jgi:hypothetical protein